MEAKDPVFTELSSGSWWFWDETWCEPYGPYATEEEARAGLLKYQQEMLNVPKPLEIPEELINLVIAADLAVAAQSTLAIEAALNKLRRDFLLKFDGERWYAYPKTGSASAPALLPSERLRGVLSCVEGAGPPKVLGRDSEASSEATCTVDRPELLAMDDIGRISDPDTYADLGVGLRRRKLEADRYGER